MQFKAKATNLVLTALAVSFPLAVNALEVVFEDKVPSNLRTWVDKGYCRQQMEVTAPRICKLLYDGKEKENYSDNLTIVLNPIVETHGNPGFASGKKITWRVGADPQYDSARGIGLLGHEMTHVLDANTWPKASAKFKTHYDGKFVEATAVWVTDYKIKYGYRKYTSPSILLDRRYDALRYRREWGGYRAGAGFFDFLEQTYGEGTAVKLIQDMLVNGIKPWERILGKTMEQLEAEWRQMETIYDPVFQWNYNGTAAGAVRKDKGYCTLGGISAENADDKSGAWLNGVTPGSVDKVADGCLTIALHGRFSGKGKTMVASLGAVKEGNGKALLLTIGSKSNELVAHVVASAPGKGCQVVASAPVPLTAGGSANAASHSVILTVKNGGMAAVIVDGKPVAKLDMKTKCEGCTFTPVFAVGGMSQGLDLAGFVEPRGKGEVLLDDVRVFTRTFRSREAAKYAEVFGPDYRGAVAVEATWRGPQGSSDIANPENWLCFNSYGEQIVALPSKETDILLWYKAIPSIPAKSKFACKSFTIDGIAVIDEANVDLRGVRIVDLADNTRIITKKGHSLAANAIRAKRIRLDGSLAVKGGIKADGNLEMAAGSELRLPEDPNHAMVKSLTVKGKGTVVVNRCEEMKKGVFNKLMRIMEMPDDLSRFRLNKSDSPKDAHFSPASGGKFLGVMPK